MTYRPLEEATTLTPDQAEKDERHQAFFKSPGPRVIGPLFQRDLQSVGFYYATHESGVLETAVRVEAPREVTQAMRDKLDPLRYQLAHRGKGGVIAVVCNRAPLFEEIWADLQRWQPLDVRIANFRLKYYGREFGDGFVDAFLGNDEGGAS